MMQRALVVLALVACRGHADEHAAAPTGSAAPAVKAAPTGSAAASEPAPLPPPTQLVAAIPADTPFVLVSLDPALEPFGAWLRALDPKLVRAAAQARLATALGPLEKLAAAAWVEVAGALATPDAAGALGVAARPRFAIYAVGIVPVARLELADAAKTAAVIDRIAPGARQPGATPTWLVDGGGQTVAIAIAGGQLIVARGPHGELRAALPKIVGAPATPITEAELRAFAKTKELPGQAIGWIDTARIAALVKQAPELAQVPAECRDGAVALLGKLGRIGIAANVSRDRLALAFAADVPPAMLAAIQAATKSLPSLPATVPGAPLVAASMIALPDAATPPWGKLATACGGHVAQLPPPLDTLQAGAFVLYDAHFTGLMPVGVDGYVALASPAPDRLLAAGVHLTPALAVTVKDGAPPVAIPEPTVALVVPGASLARRGSTLFALGGAKGRAHFEDFKVRDAAPLFRLAIATARLAADDDAPASKPSDDEYFRAEGASASKQQLGRAIAQLAGNIEITVEARASDVRLTIVAGGGTVTKPKPAPADPRAKVRDECWQILRSGLAAAQPSLAKLGVTTDLDGIASTYLSSIEADQAVRACAKLDAKARACILAAPNVIAAAPKCAPGSDSFHESALELPPLFSFFGPRPLETQLYPVDPRARLAKLVGTWMSKGSFATETWLVEPNGHLTRTRREQDGETKTETFTLRVRDGGHLELGQGDGWEGESIFLLDDRTFYTDDDFAPITREDHFIVKVGDQFVVRDGASCSVITKQGLDLAATCTPATEDGRRELKVTTDHDEIRLAFVPGYVVSSQVLEGTPFRRQ